MAPGSIGLILGRCNTSPAPSRSQLFPLFHHCYSLYKNCQRQGNVIKLTVSFCKQTSGFYPPVRKIFRESFYLWPFTPRFRRQGIGLTLLYCFHTYMLKRGGPPDLSLHRQRMRLGVLTIGSALIGYAPFTGRTQNTAVILPFISISFPILQVKYLSCNGKINHYRTRIHQSCDQRRCHNRRVQMDFFGQQGAAHSQ